MRLLDVSSRAEGVRIYIGGESLVVPFEELSVVSAPYEVDGRIVGTLGVIGPDAHGLRPHDPDRRHHLAAGQQRAERAALINPQRAALIDGTSPAEAG